MPPATRPGQSKMHGPPASSHLASHPPKKPTGADTMPAKSTATPRFELWKIERGPSEDGVALVGRHPTFASACVAAYAFGPGVYRVCDERGNLASVRVARRKHHSRVQ